MRFNFDNPIAAKHPCPSTWDDMNEHYGKIRVCSLLKIKAHTFGVFRPFGRPGATFWRLSQASAPAALTLLAIFTPIVTPHSRRLAIYVLAPALATTLRRLLYPSTSQRTFGDFRSHPPAVLWRHPLAALVLAPAPATAACASDRGSRAQKEAAWGRRRPLGRGTCAWGTLC